MPKKNGSIIPKWVLPPDAERITNNAGERVWLINGKEYLSKREYFQYLQDSKLAAELAKVQMNAILNAPLTIIAKGQEAQVRAMDKFVEYDPAADKTPIIPEDYPSVVIGHLPETWIAVSDFMPDGYWQVFRPRRKDFIPFDFGSPKTIVQLAVPD